MYVAFEILKYLLKPTTLWSIKKHFVRSKIRATNCCRVPYVR